MFYLEHPTYYIFMDISGWEAAGYGGWWLSKCCHYLKYQIMQLWCTAHSVSLFQWALSSASNQSGVFCLYSQKMARLQLYRGTLFQVQCKEHLRYFSLKTPNKRDLLLWVLLFFLCIYKLTVLNYNVFVQLIIYVFDCKS